VDGIECRCDCSWLTATLCVFPAYSALLPLDFEVVRGLTDVAIVVHDLGHGEPLKPQLMAVLTRRTRDVRIEIRGRRSASAS
jgi:hypothetical protein